MRVPHQYLEHKKRVPTREKEAENSQAGGTYQSQGRPEVLMLVDDPGIDVMVTFFPCLYPTAYVYCGSSEFKVGG